MSSVLLTIVLGAIGSLLAAIVYGWLPTFAKTFARWLASNTPAQLKDRLREEWLAEIDAVPESFGKLIYALQLSPGVLRLRGAATRRAYAASIVDDRRNAKTSRRRLITVLTPFTLVGSAYMLLDMWVIAPSATPVFFRYLLTAFTGLYYARFAVRVVGALSVARRK